MEGYRGVAAYTLYTPCSTPWREHRSIQKEKERKKNYQILINHIADKVTYVMCMELLTYFKFVNRYESPDWFKISN